MSTFRFISLLTVSRIGHLRESVERTPHGRRTAASSSHPRAGFRDIHGRTLSNRGAASRSDRDKFVQSVSHDRIVFLQDDDFWLLPLTAGSRAEHFRVSEQAENFGSVSPDGRWFLYQSNEEGGQNKVFVTSFPARAGKWLISAGGGILPKWSADGREIFYLAQDHSTMVAAAVGEEAGSFGPSIAKRLFSAPMVSGRGYPPTRVQDGKRFLALLVRATTTPPRSLLTGSKSAVTRSSIGPVFLRTAGNPVSRIATTR